MADERVGLPNLLQTRSGRCEDPIRLSFLAVVGLRTMAGTGFERVAVEVSRPLERFGARPVLYGVTKLSRGKYAGTD